jgi:dTDP-4-amino-4,6-dideoxygalactose transaminase
MHLQPAAKFLGHAPGDFPACESTVQSVLSLPVHEFITRDQQDRVVDSIREFYHR